MSKLTITCSEFKSLHKNSLVGFATLRIAEMCLSIRDCAVHQKGDSRWVQLPARQQIGKDGRAIVKDGKAQYSMIFEFDGRVVRDAFSAAAVAAVIRHTPQAFDEANP